MPTRSFAAVASTSIEWPPPGAPVTLQRARPAFRAAQPILLVFWQRGAAHAGQPGRPRTWPHANAKPQTLHCDHPSTHLPTCFTLAMSILLRPARRSTSQQLRAAAIRQGRRMFTQLPPLRVEQRRPSAVYSPSAFGATRRRPSAGVLSRCGCPNVHCRMPPLSSSLPGACAPPARPLACTAGHGSFALSPVPAPCTLAGRSARVSSRALVARARHRAPIGTTRGRGVSSAAGEAWTCSCLL